MSNETALVAVEEKQVDFYGDLIPAALVEIAGQPQVVVPLRPICDKLGLDWSAQTRRLKRDENLAEATTTVAMMATIAKRRYDLLCIPLELLPGWLFTIDLSRVKPELKPRLKLYRAECFKVLWQAFQADVLGAAPLETVSPSVKALMQIRENSLAIARMAEQQIELEKRVDQHDSRFDKAVEVFRGLDRRVSELESRISPQSLINEAQAAEIQLAVKAAAEYLSRQDGTKNHFQSIFQELYRHFRVSSYKNIRAGDYETVLAFLRNLAEQK